MGQKKKQDAEERRSRQKKAREDFKKMLEVCSLLVLKFRLPSLCTSVYLFLPLIYFIFLLNFFGRNLRT